MRARYCWALLSATIAAAALTSPAGAADRGNGERLAQRWCASCHLVAPGQGGPTGEAPPFTAIAAKPNIDAAQIAFYLLMPHPRMPDMALSRAEAADLAAYIAGIAR